MSARTKPPFRYDHVGSLLRPEALLASRDKFKAGDITAEELRAHEDECIIQAVKLQEESGLKAVTDGEFRRESFHVDFIGQIKNVTSSWDFDEAVQMGEDHKAGGRKGPGETAALLARRRHLSNSVNAWWMRAI